MRRSAIVLAIIALGAACAGPMFAMTAEEGRAQLQQVYATRPDLQAVFTPDGTTIPGTFVAGKLSNLEEWAKRYGWREHPNLLSWYAPGPRALEPRAALSTPVKTTAAAFDPALVTAERWMVIDVGTRKTLLEHGADTPHSMASLTKLMTAMVSLEKGLPMAGSLALAKDDEVGGARLNATPGTVYSVRDLFDAMLVGSANNATNAVSRATGLEKQAFVDAMNAKAAALGLKETSFVDPTGIEVENVSTAREIAALSLEAFDIAQIRRATTTAKATLTTGPSLHTIRNTNDLLVDPDNGLFVLGGKTGYLIESKWNLAVKMRDASHPALMVVTLGSGNKPQSFKDAETLARWVWRNYQWQR